MKINRRNIQGKTPENSRPISSWYRSFGSYLLIAVLLAGLLAGCDSDDVGDTYYTFTGETMGDYIANRPETYSEFSRMLELGGVMGLLNAYGKYTCFLPDNEAMFNFYHSKGKNSLDDFTADTLKKIAYDHIISDFIVTSDEFVDGFLPNLTMSGRYLKISFEPGESTLLYRVNTTSVIGARDIEVHNGVVHTINKVLSPTENTLIEAIAADDDFSLFFEALIATGLDRELLPIKDETYDPGSLYEEREGTFYPIGSIIHVPKERKYGFTALMENNATYANAGINDLEDMKEYARGVYDLMYPEDASITDITDRRNSLNRFVAYHLINKKLSSRLFIEKYDNTGQFYESRGETHSIKTVDMFEYIETLCPNTLLEVRTLRTTSEYNQFNMIPESGDVIRLTENFDNDAVNGVYHEIDNILAYSQAVDRMISSKRLRMDAASFFPELTNNNIRVGHATPDYPSEMWYFPRGYIERLKTSETTNFAYYNADDRFCDYQGDEVWLQGLYDFEITTPPIPAGTYEVRFGYQPTIFRGAAQLYWDGKPTGIPLDLRIYASEPEIGYVQPGLDPADPEGFENDKMMRNRGYMKGPASFKVINTAWYSGASARMSPAALRRILGIFTFNEASTHTFAVKAVRAGEFMFDYLEFVPVEVLEYEDIY
ncbi:MAG: fasciclin domain-containing protein [Bacteroidales bacterium]|nr:fasciclin domain-containing protein [Bacteroidales bacterium]